MHLCVISGQIKYFLVDEIVFVHALACMLGVSMFEKCGRTYRLHVGQLLIECVRLKHNLVLTFGLRGAT